MNRDEILAMEPGRELDVLVMRIVFKAEKKDIGDECYWVSEVNGEEVCWPRWFSPSTDIAAAFEVWEHDRPEDWIFDLSYIKGKYYAEIFKPYVGVVAKVRVKSAAEAMSKCRLLAVMDGENENERD